MIIHSENENNLHDLASVTKIMTALVTLEEVRKGNVSLNDKIYFDEHDMKIGGSTAKSKLITSHTLKQLLDILLVYSANNAAYAIAKHVGKNLDHFVELMNNKARELHMGKTHYYTPAGLPTSYTKRQNDVSTAFDQVLLIEYILKNYPELIEIASQEEVIFDGQKLPNRNKLINTFDNIGVKTGYHKSAGYNMVGLYKHNNVYTVVVTFGDKNEIDRFNTQKKLYEEAKQYIQDVVDKNTFYEKIDKLNLTLKVKDSYSTTLENIRYKIDLIDLKKVKEIKKDEIVGSISVYSGNKFLVNLPLYAQNSYKRQLPISLYIGSFLLFLAILVIYMLKYVYTKYKGEKQ